jgi:hypothetical protein
LKVVKRDITKTRLGADELNLAEFPLAVFSHRGDPSQKTVEFEDEIYDEGAKRSIRRRLVISGSDRFGLPSPVDTDVLLVLIQLNKQRTNFDSKVLSFSRYELIELLRWNHSGASYKRLEDTLQRWVSTTLYYHHAWWDRAVRGWKSKTFHVIDTLDLKGNKREEPDDSLCSLAWNEVLFQSFQSSNLKSLDLDTYFHLKRPAARQAYRFLDKRFYRSSHLEFDLRVFACEHVGLSREHDSAQLKRALEPVLKELEQVGFLHPMQSSKRYLRQGRGRYKVVLHRNKHRSSSTENCPGNSLASELTNRGVWADVAPALANALPEAEIKRYIALHDWLLKRHDKRIARNPAGFLAACIANRLPFPADFERIQNPVAGNTPSGVITKPVPSPGKRLCEPPRNAESVAIENELSHLTADEQRNLEAEAVLAAKPFVIATYERLKNEGGTLFEEVRHAIIVEHMKKLKLAAENITSDSGLRDVG